MSYTVTAPLIQVRRENGTFVHLSEGAPLPDDIDPKQLDQLVEGGFVSSDGPRKAKRKTSSPTAADAGDAGTAADTSGSDTPAGNASHEAWVEFAVVHGGMSQEEANGLSRDELRDRFTD